MDLIQTVNSHTRDPKQLIALTFEILNAAEISKKAYKILSENNLAKQLIGLYYSAIESGDFKVNYESMIYNFKEKYVKAEAAVEYNAGDKKLEYKGLGYMYDYIEKYIPCETDFNIFIEGLKLHELLYKASDDNNKEERIKEYNALTEQLERAKESRNIAEYKKAKELLKAFSDTNSKFGGQLRNEEVDLKGVEFHVPSPIEAKIFFNNFLSSNKKVEYNNAYTADLFTYINYCIKTCVEIIKNQPFGDGNKRTARALLNLMFKNRNIPPVYILKKERTVYKDALIKAIKDKDYTDIINFYYFKICDSIYELDIKQYKDTKPGSIDFQKTIEKSKEITDDSDIKVYIISRKIK